MLCESPSKGNQGTTRGKEKILLTSVGIEPTTSGLDLPVTVTFSNVCSLKTELLCFGNSHIVFLFIVEIHDMVIILALSTFTSCSRFPKKWPARNFSKRCCCPPKTKEKQTFCSSLPLFVLVQKYANTVQQKQAFTAILQHSQRC